MEAKNKIETQQLKLEEADNLSKLQREQNRQRFETTIALLRAIQREAQIREQEAMDERTKADAEIAKKEEAGKAAEQRAEQKEKEATEKRTLLRAQQGQAQNQLQATMEARVKAEAEVAKSIADQDALMRVHSPGAGAGATPNALAFFAPSPLLIRVGKLLQNVKAFAPKLAADLQEEVEEIETYYQHCQQHGLTPDARAELERGVRRLNDMIASQTAPSANAAAGAAALLLTARPPTYAPPKQG